MGVKAYLDGILGEDKACKFLKKQGFEILKRNFHSKFGEIDIIAKKDEILHFIEVKLLKMIMKFPSVWIEKNLKKF